MRILVENGQQQATEDGTKLNNKRREKQERQVNAVKVSLHRERTWEMTINLPQDRETALCICDAEGPK